MSEPAGKGKGEPEWGEPEWLRGAPGWFKGCHSGCVLVTGVVVGGLMLWFLLWWAFSGG